MERQIHGFLYEQNVIKKYNIQKSKDYTDKWDGYYNGIPCSIKCEKYGSDIELADYFRNSKIDSDFYLFVGFWQNEKDNIVENQILYIKNEEWKKLFGTKEYNDNLKEMLQNITNKIEDDAKWKEQINKFKKIWKQITPNLIRPRFKRDHKSQKRIQCAINNKDFYNFFVKNYGVELI